MQVNRLLRIWRQLSIYIYMYWDEIWINQNGSKTRRVLIHQFDTQMCWYLIVILLGSTRKICCHRITCLGKIVSLFFADIFPKLFLFFSTLAFFFVKNIDLSFIRFFFWSVLSLSLSLSLSLFFSHLLNCLK